jgi:hypothetical protein
MSERSAGAAILQLREPCDVAWEDMQGDGEVRFCACCQRDVHDLSALTRTEARELLASRGSNVCVNFLVDADGKMLTRPEPPDQQRRLRTLSTVAALAVASTGTSMVAGCSKELRDGSPLETTLAATSAASPQASVLASSSALPTATTPPPAPIDVAEAVPSAATTSAPRTKAPECKQPPPHRTGGKPRF